MYPAIVGVLAFAACFVCGAFIASQCFKARNKEEDNKTHCSPEVPVQPVPASILNEKGLRTLSGNWTHSNPRALENGIPDHPHVISSPVIRIDIWDKTKGQTKKKPGTKSVRIAFEEKISNLGDAADSGISQQIMSTVYIFLPVAVPGIGKSTMIEKLMGSAATNLAFFTSMESFRDPTPNTPVLVKVVDEFFADMLKKHPELSLAKIRSLYRKDFFGNIISDFTELCSNLKKSSADNNSRAAIIIDKNHVPKSYDKNGQLNKPGGWHATIDAIRRARPSHIHLKFVGVFANGLLQGLDISGGMAEGAPKWPFPYSPILPLLVAHRITKRLNHQIIKNESANEDKVLRGLRTFRLFDVTDFSFPQQGPSEAGAEATSETRAREVLVHPQFGGFDDVVTWPVIRPGAHTVLNETQMRVVQQAMEATPTHADLDPEKDADAWKACGQLVSQLITSVQSEADYSAYVYSEEESLQAWVQALEDALSVPT